MSAYIVSDETINCIMNFALEDKAVFWDSHLGKNIYIESKETAQEIGQRLVDANYASVNYRYGEDDKPTKFLFFRKPGEYSLGDVVGCILCLNYQSCETSDWEDSDEGHFLKVLMWRIAGNAVEKLGQEIPWGL